MANTPTDMRKACYKGTFPDTFRQYFGDGKDVYMTWDGTNLLIVPSTDDYLWEIGDSATTQVSFDLKWYANEASGASYLYFDASANLIYTTGVDLQFKDSDYLVFGTGAGASGDVSVTWDGTNLIVTAAADDSLIEIGDSAATQKSFDLKWYANEANGASYLYADASANLIYTTGIDLQFKDSDYLVFGTGAGATGDVQITWDGTNLLMTATADDSIFEIGDAAATQKSFDVKIYGDAANGADYLFWDAGASTLSTEGVNGILRIGTFASAAVGGTALSASRTAAVRFYADDGNTTIATGNHVRTTVNRFLVLAAEGNDVTIEACQNQAKIGTTTPTTTSYINGAYDYLEVAAAASVAGYYSANRSMVDCGSNAVTVAASSVMSSYLAECLFNGTITETGVCAGLWVGKAKVGSTNTWPQAIYVNSADKFCKIVSGTAYEAGAKVATVTPGGTGDAVVKWDIAGTTYYMVLYAAGSISGE